MDCRTFPDWFRKLACAWIHLTCTPAKTLHKREPRITSNIFAAVVESFVPAEGFDFITGIDMQYNGEAYHIQSKFGVVIADAKQHAEDASLKGSSGTRCCPDCKNA